MTVMESLRAFILADATLAAKVGSRIYPEVLPQGAMGATATECAAVIKVVSAMSWSTLAGATDQANMRIEVTFWATKFNDAEVAANRLRVISASFLGAIGGGVTMACFQTFGPRTLHDPETRLVGCQLDIMATVDLSTVA